MRDLISYIIFFGFFWMSGLNAALFSIMIFELSALLLDVFFYQKEISFLEKWKVGALVFCVALSAICKNPLIFQHKTTLIYFVISFFCFQNNLVIRSLFSNLLPPELLNTETLPLVMKKLGYLFFLGALANIMAILTCSFELWIVVKMIIAIILSVSISIVFYQASNKELSS